MNASRYKQRVRRQSGRIRRGVVAVEAAVVMPVVMIILFGVWEVGRLTQVSQILSNAAREGARVAAGGSVNGTAVTTTTVTQAVRDYLTSAGLPTGTVNLTQITVTNLSTNTWIEPGDAITLDRFSVSVTIPSGTAFNNLAWSPVHSITGVTQMTATTDWLSARDRTLSIGSTLPF